MTAIARFIPEPVVVERTTLSRSEIRRRITAGTFPKPVRLGGPRRVAWDERAIEAWIEARIAEADGSATE